MPPADQLLKTVVPTIERSAAYKADGLILITFDEAPQTGLHADPSACCNTPTYPNVPVVSASAASSLSPLPPTTHDDRHGHDEHRDNDHDRYDHDPATTTTTPRDYGHDDDGTTATAPPSTPAPAGTGQTTPTGGGGQVGLLVISRYVKPGTSDLVDYYNHYSLLATIENLFALKRLGYAGDLSLPVFDAAIFNAH